MKQKLSAPIAFFLAGVVVVIHLSSISVLSGRSDIPDQSIPQLFFTNRYMLPPEMALHFIAEMMFIFVLIFGVAWLFLSLLSRE